MPGKSLAWVMPTRLVPRAVFLARRPPVPPRPPYGIRAVLLPFMGRAPTTGSKGRGPTGEGKGRAAYPAIPRARSPPGAFPPALPGRSRRLAMTGEGVTG
jgi:hypothetical protein